MTEPVTIYPYYDGTPPHVAGSETSLEAAQKIAESAGAVRHCIWRHILAYGTGGQICDEVEDALDLLHTTASARIRELTLDGRLIKTARKRLTRSKRSAFVYVATEQPVPLDEEPSVERRLRARIADLEAENSDLRRRIAQLCTS